MKCSRKVALYFIVLCFLPYQFSCTGKGVTGINSNNGNYTQTPSGIANAANKSDSGTTKPLVDPSLVYSQKNMNQTSGVASNSGPGSVTYNIDSSPTSKSPSLVLGSSSSSAPFALNREDIQWAESFVRQSVLRQWKSPLYPEDVFTLALLKYHQVTNNVPSPGSIKKGIEQILAKYEIPGWRMSALQEFWAKYTTSNWAVVGPGQHTLAMKFDWYLLTKYTEGMRRHNQWLGGIVASEQAWSKVMSDWRTQEMRRYTLEEIGRRELEAWQTIQDAEWAIKEAAKALGQ